jgi:hypothetical protein
MRNYTPKLLLLALPVVLLAGCQRQFTRERFDLIRPGVDDREDVRRIIGKPASDLQDQWFYDDLDRHYSAVIFFEGQKVSRKEWMDARSGEWTGQNPHANPPPEGEVRHRQKNTRVIDD